MAGFDETNPDAAVGFFLAMGFLIVMCTVSCVCLCREQGEISRQKNDIAEMVKKYEKRKTRSKPTPQDQLAVDVEPPDPKRTSSTVIPAQPSKFVTNVYGQKVLAPKKTNLDRAPWQSVHREGMERAKMTHTT